MKNALEVHCCKQHVATLRPYELQKRFQHCTMLIAKAVLRKGAKTRLFIVDSYATELKFLTVFIGTVARLEMDPNLLQTTTFVFVKPQHHCRCFAETVPWFLSCRS